MAKIFFFLIQEVVCLLLMVSIDTQSFLYFMHSRLRSFRTLRCAVGILQKVLTSSIISSAFLMFTVSFPLSCSHTWFNISGFKWKFISFRRNGPIDGFIGVLILCQFRMNQLAKSFVGHFEMWQDQVQCQAGWGLALVRSHKVANISQMWCLVLQQAGDSQSPGSRSRLHFPEKEENWGWQSPSSPRKLWSRTCSRVSMSQLVLSAQASSRRCRQLSPGQARLPKTLRCKWMNCCYKEDNDEIEKSCWKQKNVLGDHKFLTFRTSGVTQVSPGNKTSHADFISCWHVSWFPF